MAAITICSDFGAPLKIKLATVSPSICHEVMGPDAGICVPSHLAGLPKCHSVKKLPASTGDTRDRFDPWSGRFPGIGSSTPLHYSCLGIPIEGGAWRTTVYEAAKTQTRLSTHIAGQCLVHQGQCYLS